MTVRSPVAKRLNSWMRRGAIVSLACLGLTATSSTALPAYDGLWSVSIVTEKGDCDRGYRYPIRITRGVLSNAGDTVFAITNVPLNRNRHCCHIAASHRTTSRTLYNFLPPAAAVPRVVTPVVITQAPALAPGQVLNLSGQFQCVEGCPGGQPGVAVVTQSGWDLNLVIELGQPTRAWVDWPGHIWAQSWNEGAVYSPDGMTIQFDNGTVWRRNIELLGMPSMPAR